MVSTSHLLRAGRRRRQLVTATVAAALFPACVSGVVRDAVDDVGVAATVSAYALCEGAGCTVQGVGWQQTTAVLPEGRFLYDAYSADTKALVMPASGREALELRFAAPGFLERTVYHKPSYVKGSDGREASLLPQLVYLCRVGSRDSDGDSLCDAAEARYGTNAYTKDTDRDGLPDDYELFGAADLDLAAYGANPLRRDVFVEVDYYVGQTPYGYVDNTFDSEAVARVVAAFAAAPLQNPDGSTGISLHVHADDPIDPAVYDSDAWFVPAWDFDTIKASFFDPRRAPAFHYALFAYASALGPNVYGTSRWIPAHDFVLTMHDDGDDPQLQAISFMHELGHNLGLDHGGNDSRAYKPNYFSVMSYLYSTYGMPVARDPGDIWPVLDFSRHPVAALSEAALNESTAMAPAPGSNTTESDLARYERLLVCTGQSAGNCDYLDWLPGNASASLDFDRDGDFEGAVTADLNGDGTQNDTFPASINDWNALIYTGDALIGGGTIGDPHGAGGSASVAAFASDSWLPCEGAPRLAAP